MAYFYIVKKENAIYNLVKKEQMRIVFDKFTFENNTILLKDYIMGFVDDVQIQGICKNENEKSFKIDLYKQVEINIDI